MCIFDQIKGNLTEIEPKNHQNVQETPLLQKAPGFNGLTDSCKPVIVKNSGQERNLQSSENENVRVRLFGMIWIINDHQ